MSVDVAARFSSNFSIKDDGNCRSDRREGRGDSLKKGRGRKVERRGGMAEFDLNLLIYSLQFSHALVGL